MVGSIIGHIVFEIVVVLFVKEEIAVKIINTIVICPKKDTLSIC